MMSLYKVLLNKQLIDEGFLFVFSVLKLNLMASNTTWDDFFVCFVLMCVFLGVKTDPGALTVQWSVWSVPPAVGMTGNRPNSRFRWGKSLINHGGVAFWASARVSPLFLRLIELTEPRPRGHFHLLLYVTDKQQWLGHTSTTTAERKLKSAGTHTHTHSLS